MVNRLTLTVALLLPWAGAAGAEEAGSRGLDWPQLRGGPGFNGVSPDASVKPPLKLVWSYRCDSDTSGDACAGMAVSGGGVFAKMCMTKSVLALDAETGRFLWEVGHRDSEPHATPSCEGERVFDWLRAYGRSAVVALDAASGKELWNRKLKSSAGLLARRAGPAVIDGRVYVADLDDGPVILALDAKTGDEVWRRPLGKEDGSEVAAPCVAAGLVFTGTKVKFEKGGEVRGRIVALDAKDGKEVWSRRDVYPSAHMVSDGQILVAKSTIEIGMKPNDRLKMYVLEARTGKDLWSVPVQHLYSTETITGDAVIQKHYGGGMTALERATGKKLWELGIKTGSGCCSPSVSGDYAYVGTGSFNDSEGFWAWRFVEPPHRQKGETGLCWTLHAIDLKTGKSVWQFLTGNNVCGDPAIAYGRLYFNSRDGRIYCLAPAKPGESPLPDSPDKSPAAPADEVRKLLAEALPAPVPGRDWPMAGGTPERAGLEGITLAPPLAPAWQLDTGGRVVASAAIRDGRVYVGSLSGKIFAADLATGAKAWEVKTGGEVRCAPAVADGLVYCGSDDGFFRALDAATGAEKWKYACGGPVQAAPAVVGGTVVFGANDGHVYMLERRTGKKLWSFRGDYPLVQAPPVVRGTQVFAAQWVDWAYALDAATGKEQWRTCVPISIEALQFHRDKLWLRSAYQFAEFDPASGKRLRIGDAAYGCNGLAFLKNFFITTGTGGTASVDLDQPGTDEKGKTPNLESEKVLGGKGLIGSPRLASAGTPLALGDKLAFATRDGEVAITEPTGKILWNTKLGGTCHATPVAAAGTLVVGCDDGMIYAFREKGH